jgi:hypothetical protein
MGGDGHAFLVEEGSFIFHQCLNDIYRLCVYNIKEPDKTKVVCVCCGRGGGLEDEGYHEAEPFDLDTMREWLMRKVEVQATASRHEVMVLYEEYAINNKLDGMSVDSTNLFQTHKSTFLDDRSFQANTRPFLSFDIRDFGRITRAEAMPAPRLASLLSLLAKLINMNKVGRNDLHHKDYQVIKAIPHACDLCREGTIRWRL